MHRYILEVEGPNLVDLEEIELLELPGKGEPIETRFGTCIVIALEAVTGDTPYSGKIICRMP